MIFPRQYPAAKLCNGLFRFPVLSTGQISVLDIIKLRADGVGHIQIKPSEPDETFSLADDLLLGDLGEGDSLLVQESYLTLESDIPVEGPAKTVSKGISPESDPNSAGSRRKGARKDEGPEKSSDSPSFSVKPTP